MLPPGAPGVSAGGAAGGGPLVLAQRELSCLTDDPEVPSDMVSTGTRAGRSRICGAEYVN